MVHTAWAPEGYKGWSQAGPKPKDRILGPEGLQRLLVLHVNLESHICDKCAVRKSTFQVCSSWTCVSSTYKYIGAEAEIDFLLLASFALYTVQYTPTLCHADSSPIIYIFLIIWCSETDLSFICCVCKDINFIFCLKIDPATAQPNI